MSTSFQTSRRDFLKAATVGSAVFGTSLAPLVADETRKSTDNRGLPKKVIFMVSDGMNHGALSLAQQSRSRFEGKQTHWVTLYRERPVVRALMETASASSLVTDSAAAASSWGGGKRVINGVLNMDPGTGAPVATLQSLLKEKDIPVGLVSTASITHATPAGFAANVPDRGDESGIAGQYLDHRVEVLLGGGRKYFSDSVLQGFQTAGYERVEHRSALLAADHLTKKPLLGLFASGHLPYEIDRSSEQILQERIPSLSEMARTAVSRLDAVAKDRWFLMVEGARIDHAGHANDAAGSIRDQLAFDDAIGEMVAYATAREDVLLVITTDHGCGGIQVNGMGAGSAEGFPPGSYNANNRAFDCIPRFKHSFEWLANSGAGLSGPPLAAFLKEHTGLDLDRDEIRRAQGLNSATLGRIYSTRHGISWTSGNHTGDLVEFCAYGPGSHLFPGYLRNDEVHRHLLSALSAVG